jgi:REP element-mobilizing transposase RayT
MGHSLRIPIPGMAYHVMARGNERKNIYRDISDRKKFIQILKEASELYDFKVYAYTLMSNHYHLLIRIDQPNLSQIMKYINGGYAVYFNWKYKRIGHLFHHKFKAVIVEHGPELQNCMRYIHLNPLRAGMIENLDEYPWTSHKQYRGQEKGAAEPEHLLKLFSNDRLEAIAKYEKHMGEGGMKDKDGDTMYNFGKHAIGSEDFVRKIKLMFKEKDLSKDINNRKELKKVYGQDIIIKAVCGYYKITEDELKKKGGWNSKKPEAYYLLSRDGGLKNTQIAELFGKIHPSMVGRKINRISALIGHDARLKRKLVVIRKGFDGEK